MSTVDDLLAFSQMTLNGGAHGPERFLSRPSVELTLDEKGAVLSSKPVRWGNPEGRR